MENRKPIQKCKDLDVYNESFDVAMEIFDETTRIKRVNEIHDRIIVATARFYQGSILTKDRIISESGEVETI